MTATQKVYLVTLEGGGDLYVKVVDQETFDWITSDDPGIPEAESDDDDGVTLWEDQTVPPSQVAKLKAIGDYPVEITSGSWENDRAIAAQPADGYDTYDTVAEALKAIRRNKAELEDEYHGGMY